MVVKRFCRQAIGYHRTNILMNYIPHYLEMNLWYFYILQDYTGKA